MPTDYHEVDEDLVISDIRSPMGHDEGDTDISGPSNARRASKI